MSNLDIKNLINWSILKKLIKKNKILRGAFYPISITRGIYLRKKIEAQHEIINNLKELLVEHPIIKVDEFQGNFFLDCRSDLFKRLVINKCYEPKLAQCCRDLIDKNRDAIDIGANVGFFTVLFAKELNNRKVLAIEPTKQALYRLYKNIQLNQVEQKVAVFEGVASNIIGNVEIKTIDGKEEYSSLGVMAHPSIANGYNISVEKVVANTLDNLISKYSIDPGFIKVDVEGVEHLIFDGARKTLSTNRPIIFSELSDYLLRQNGTSAQAVVDFIKDYDYNVINPLAPNNPIIFKEIKNILCVPK